MSDGPTFVGRMEERAKNDAAKIAELEAKVKELEKKNKGIVYRSVRLLSDVHCERHIREVKNMNFPEFLQRDQECKWCLEEKAQALRAENERLLDVFKKRCSPVELIKLPIEVRNYVLEFGALSSENERLKARHVTADSNPDSPDLDPVSPPTKFSPETKPDLPPCPNPSWWGPSRSTDPVGGYHRKLRKRADSLGSNPDSPAENDITKAKIETHKAPFTRLASQKDLPPCPSCGSDDIDLVSVTDDYHYVYCRGCGACGSHKDTPEAARDAWDEMPRKEVFEKRVIISVPKPTQTEMRKIIADHKLAEAVRKLVKNRRLKLHTYAPLETFGSKWREITSVEELEKCDPND